MQCREGQSCSPKITRLLGFNDLGWGGLAMLERQLEGEGGNVCAKACGQKSTVQLEA